MQRSQRWILVLSTLFLAHGAYAASLNVSADAGTYQIGDPITLTVTGSIVPTMDAAPNFFVSVDLPPNVSFVSSTADTALNPPPMFGPQTTWAVGGIQGSVLTGNSLRVFDQIQGLPPGAPFVNNHSPDFSSAFVTATVVLTATGPGSNVPFDFGTLTNFFGINGASPGTTVNIVPEPASAALLSLGLSAIALGRQRRQRAG